MSERAFWAQFDDDKPAILGALLDLVAGGLREAPNVQLTDRPRMADFAEWGVACEQAAPDVLFPVGTFAKAYARNRARAAHSVVEEDLVANAIQGLLAEQIEWCGNAGQLLKDLNKVADDPVKQNREWPKASNALSRRMFKASGALRKIGIQIQATTEKKTNRRFWRITRAERKAVKRVI